MVSYKLQSIHLCHLKKSCPVILNAFYIQLNLNKSDICAIYSLKVEGLFHFMMQIMSYCTHPVLYPIRLHNANISHGCIMTWFFPRLDYQCTSTHDLPLLPCVVYILYVCVTFFLSVLTLCFIHIYFTKSPLYKFFCMQICRTRFCCEVFILLCYHMNN